MRVVVDGMPLLHWSSGVGRFLHEILRRFPQVDGDLQVLVSGVERVLPLDSKLLNDFLETGRPDHGDSTRAAILNAVSGIRNSWLGDALAAARRNVLAHSVARSRASIFYGANFTGVFGLSFRTVITIHDMAHHYYPRAANPSTVRCLGSVLQQHANKSAAIVTNSQHSRRDIVNLLQVPPEKVHVVYCGVGPAFRTQIDEATLVSAARKYDLPEKFILFVGTCDPRKNLELLVQAYDLLAKRKELPHELVIAGTEGWNDQKLQKALDRTNHKERIRRIGFIDDRDLPAIYNLADVLVLPSLYEGFGMPVIEAMACGTPVVASSAGALPEVVGSAGLLFDPKSPEECALAIAQLITDGTLSRSLVSAGLERAKQFRWEETARAIVQVFRTVAS